MIAITTPMRNPELCVREGREGKSSSVAGNGLMLLAGRSAAGFSALLGGLCVVCSIRLLIAFQILFHALFRVADGISQLHLGKIVEIKTLNVALVSGGNSLLRLHHFQIVSNARGETNLGLGERLFRQVNGTASDFHVLSGCVQAEEGSAILVIDASF